MNQEQFERLGIEFGFENETELREQLKEYNQLCIEKAKSDLVYGVSKRWVW